MKSRLVVCIVAMAAASAHPSLGQATPDTALVLAAEQEWNAARLRGDTASLERLLDSAWTMTHVDGRVEGRRSYVAGIATGARRIQSIEPQERTVTVRGNVAIVSGEVLQRGYRRGELREGRLRFTHVWVRDSAGWRMIVAHSTEILAGGAR